MVEQNNTIKTSESNSLKGCSLHNQNMDKQNETIKEKEIRDLKESIIWLDKKMNQLQTEVKQFERGLNPIIAYEMNKQIKELNKLKEGFIIRLTNLK